MRRNINRAECSLVIGAGDVLVHERNGQLAQLHATLSHLAPEKHMRHRSRHVDNGGDRSNTREANKGMQCTMFWLAAPFGSLTVSSRRCFLTLTMEHITNENK